MAPKRTDAEELTLRIEECLLLTGMSASRFGYLHFGDPAFVKKAREGRTFRAKTRDKIEAVLKEAGV